MNKLETKIQGLLKSVFANGRDIFSTLAWIVLVLFVAQLITIGGAWLGIDLHDVKSFVFAIAKFAAVALCGVGYLTHITFRQSLGDCDLNEFMDTWKNKLTPQERLGWFFKVSIAGLVSASWVFSNGV